MDNETLQAYLRQRLKEIEEGKDLNEVTSKGRLSFGVSSRDYQDLPSWNELVKKKKRLVKMVWVNAMALSLMVVGIIGDITVKFEQNWLKALFYWLSISAIVMLFYVVWFFYSLFYEFRNTERVVRKLIYEDILKRMENNSL